MGYRDAPVVAEKSASLVKVRRGALRLLRRLGVTQAIVSALCAVLSLAAYLLT
ncbi:MAG: hypothetical protein ACXVEF_17265 [Polyangiales bacterium]